MYGYYLPNMLGPANVLYVTNNEATHETEYNLYSTISQWKPSVSHEYMNR